ncbi:MAG: BACON domain-containing protein [Planctomycetaceae bacterium]|nr:BACON domain-containing protein [Planctomycetaceae bacterium]
MKNIICGFACFCLFLGSVANAAESDFNKGELQVRTLTVPFQKDSVKHFRVQADGDWKLTTDYDWIDLEPSSGAKGEFTITAKIKATNNERNGNIKLTTAGYFGWIGAAQVDETKYYRDGDVLQIHKANPPEGRKPIPIFVIGDGWDMSDFKKGGIFETYGRGLYKIFSNVDVVKNFNEYFDFYIYFSESEQRGKFGFNQFGTTSRSATDFGRMEMFCQRYLKEIDHPNAKETTYICASNAAVGGFALDGKFAILSNPSGQPGSYAYWLVHEYAGHCLANMPDLYLRGGWVVDKDSPKAKDPVTGRMHPTTYNKGTVKDVVNMVNNFTREWARGYDWYIDWSDDPKEVVWKDFIGKPGYKNVGVYPTAFNAMFAGFYGPEKFEAMRELDHLWYGLGVRMAVWNRILERSGVKNEGVPNWLTNPDADHPRSLKSFKEFDIKNGYNNDGKHVNDFVEHPIFTAKYWVEDDYLYPERPDFEGAEGNPEKRPLVVPFPALLNFGNDGGKEAVIVTSNKAEWKLESGADWLNLSTTSGKGNGTFTVEAKPGKNRTATITITAPNAHPRKITVKQ